MSSTLKGLLLIAGAALAGIVIVAVVLFTRPQPDPAGGAVVAQDGEPAAPAAATATPVPAIATATATRALPSPVSTDPISPLPTPVPTETSRSVFLPAVEGNNAPPTAEPPPTAEADQPEEPPPDTAADQPRQMTLQSWPALSLAEWPRPAGDNGLCIHNITEAYYHEANLDLQISRLQRLNMPWTVLLYGDENQIMKAAPRFRDAGITVIWRKMLRANERYYDWERDIDLIRSFGLEPYMQLYNEPSLPAEWEGDPIDQALFMDNLLLAVEYVYNAGGYVGLQFVNDEWLLTALEEIRRHGGEQVFGRTFLIPHPYGLNHPPDYEEDANGVLGFLGQAEIVRDALGFVPPMIAGEGGWKWNATDDRRYPPIDEQRHRDFHVEVFNWFRTGVLSNGEPLPDYLFAFCPWLLSSKLDDSAWFDSFYGDHTPTIEAVEAMSNFERQFSWQQ